MSTLIRVGQVTQRQISIETFWTILAIKVPFYFVADAYYAAGKVVNGLLKQGNHLVTRVKAKTVVYTPVPRKKGRKTRGRPKTYGKNIKLKTLLANHWCPVNL